MRRGIEGGPRCAGCWPVILAVVLVLSMNVGPAMALTTKRLWQASVGTNAVNGRMSLRAYTNSTGLVTLRLKAMKANASYSVEDSAPAPAPTLARCAPRSCG